MQMTFAIIKPDAVAAGHTGAILSRIEKEGFKIVGMKKTTIKKAQAEVFYGVHKSRPFFGELVEFISSGPVVLLALQKAEAIAAWRTLMGATNPAQAAEGTIRKEFAKSIGENAVHGSDAPETAQFELVIFFPELV